MSTTHKIRGKIKEIPVGEVYTTAVFLNFGSRASIDQALMRLVKSGDITRVAPGVFFTSKSTDGKPVTFPPPIEIAIAVAEADGAVIEIGGEEAAYRLGLIPSMPLKPVYETTGPSHTITLENFTVYLKHVSPKKMVLAGSTAGQALAALRFLGKEGVTPAVIKKLSERIGEEDIMAIRESGSAIPDWLRIALLDGS